MRDLDPDWPNPPIAGITLFCSVSAFSFSFLFFLLTPHMRRSHARSLALSLAQPRAATAGTYVTSSSYRLDVERGSPLTFPRPTLSLRRSACGSASANNPNSSNLFFFSLVCVFSFFLLLLRLCCSEQDVGGCSQTPHRAPASSLSSYCMSKSAEHRVEHAEELETTRRELFHPLMRPA